jgi:hypothetical protein
MLEQVYSVYLRYANYYGVLQSAGVRSAKGSLCIARLVSLIPFLINNMTNQSSTTMIAESWLES